MFLWSQHTVLWMSLRITFLLISQVKVGIFNARVKAACNAGGCLRITWRTFLISKLFFEVRHYLCLKNIALCAVYTASGEKIFDSTVVCFVCMICCVLVFYGFLLFLLLRSFCFAATFHQEAFSIIHSTPVPFTDFCTQQRSQNEAEEVMALPKQTC